MTLRCWPRPEVLTLSDIIGQGENLHTEFKRLVHSAEKIARPISAFANTSGGTILIGVDDDKRVVGIHSEKETLEIVYDAVQHHIEPSPVIETFIEEFKRRMILKVIIPESPHKPHFHIEEARDPETLKPVGKTKVYLREGSHNRAATEEHIALLQSLRAPVSISFGNQEKKLLDYLKTHTRITAAEYGILADITIHEATATLVSLVRTGTMNLCTEGKSSYFTLPDSLLP
ncbi:MAG: ATP-binding protein [Chlorobiaceae bacterium]|nr:ATP-binding protein [Chlorobiaceae bacterium]